MSADELSRELVRNLLYLRRYARALTSSQDTGDQYARATLEALIAEPDEVGTQTARVDFFRAFHIIWSTSGQPFTGGTENSSPSRQEARAHERLASLMPNTREALLLHTVEGFPISDIAAVMSVPENEAESLVQIALNDMREMVVGDVMIIEDEAVIAMDLKAIVTSLVHRVTGVARTEAGALDLGGKTVPDLILADIQLADGSSGVDAVNGLFRKHGERPVIFITAFPERLLTGERPEPAFLITKPYTEDQVRTAVSQAMFFASTEELVV